MRIDRLAAPELSELWSLREDVTVRFDGDGATLRTPWGRRFVPRPAPAVREALRRMLLGPVSLANVIPGFPGYEMPEQHWDDASRDLLAVLDDLQDVVVRHLATGAALCLSVVPVAPETRFRPPADEPAPGHASRPTWRYGARGARRSCTPTGCGTASSCTAPRRTGCWNGCAAATAEPRRTRHPPSPAPHAATRPPPDCSPRVRHPVADL